MPMPPDFEARLYPRLEAIADHFGTPFHIYDEAGIRATARRLKAAFGGLEGFREFFAVKALPNPRILAIMADEGFGFDCSSISELILARRVGAAPDDIMFTSNNTSGEDFRVAGLDGGCRLNLDDVGLISKVPAMPEQICFRYNPGARRTGNSIIGNPVEAKYGVAHDQILAAYRTAMDRGARRFGLHTMLASNERNEAYMVQTVEMLLEVVASVGRELAIRFDYINMGGGLGIAYGPQDAPLDLEAMAAAISRQIERFRTAQGYAPRLFMESGRFMTGQHGVLVTRAINRKETYRTYVGVDACMTALMRPGIYGAYHHITIPSRLGETARQTVDVVGSLCENNDKFAIQRELPPISSGDLVVIHDTGAHGHSMGFNYNGKLRPQELLLTAEGTVERIRRRETVADYFATLNFVPEVWQAN